MTCTATYVTTQADVTAGKVDNNATVAGHSPSGTDVTGGDAADIPESPRLALVGPPHLPILPMTGTPLPIWHILRLASGLLALGIGMHLVARRRSERW